MLRLQSCIRLIETFSRIMFIVQWEMGYGFLGGFNACELELCDRFSVAISRYYKYDVNNNISSIIISSGCWDGTAYLMSHSKATPLNVQCLEL